MGGLGVGSVVLKKEGELLVDPSLEEEAGGDASVCLGIMPALGKVTDVWFTGEAEVEDACEVSNLVDGRGARLIADDREGDRGFKGDPYGAGPESGRGSRGEGYLSGKLLCCMWIFQSGTAQGI